MAKAILTENMDRLKGIAETLLEKETLEGEEMEALFTGIIPKPAPEFAAEPIAAPAIPAKAKPKTRSKSQGRKAPVIPSLLPKQSPAASD